MLRMIFPQIRTSSIWQIVPSRPSRIPDIVL
jgi:hypothetical protein